MTKSPRKNVPDVGIELGAACMPSEHASDQATTPGRFPLETYHMYEGIYKALLVKIFVLENMEIKQFISGEHVPCPREGLPYKKNLEILSTQ